MDRYFLEFLKRLQQLKTWVTVNYIDEYFLSTSWLSTWTIVNCCGLTRDCIVKCSCNTYTIKLRLASCLGLIVPASETRCELTRRITTRRTDFIRVVCEL